MWDTYECGTCMTCRYEWDMYVITMWDMYDLMNMWEKCLKQKELIMIYECKWKSEPHTVSEISFARWFVQKKSAGARTCARTSYGCQLFGYINLWKFRRQRQNKCRALCYCSAFFARKWHIRIRMIAPTFIGGPLFGCNQNEFFFFEVFSEFPFFECIQKEGRHWMHSPFNVAFRVVLVAFRVVSVRLST